MSLFHMQQPAGGQLMMQDIECYDWRGIKALVSSRILQLQLYLAPLPTTSTRSTWLHSPSPELPLLSLHSCASAVLLLHPSSMHARSPSLQTLLLLPTLSFMGTSGSLEARVSHQSQTSPVTMSCEQWIVFFFNVPLSHLSCVARWRSGSPLELQTMPWDGLS